MKIVSCCCRTQTDAQSVDVGAWFSRQYYFYLNTETFIWICFLFFFKDAWSFWPDGGSEPAQVFRHVGNSQDSTHRLPCPENYSGLLLQVCTNYAVQSHISPHCSTKNVRPQNRRRVISVVEIQTLKNKAIIKNPAKTLHPCFYFFRYKVLMRGLLNSEDPRGCCVQLLCQYDSSSAEWQLGKTKVSNTLLLCSLVQNIQKGCNPGFSLLPHFIAGLFCTRSGAGSS